MVGVQVAQRDGVDLTRVEVAVQHPWRQGRSRAAERRSDLDTAPAPGSWKLLESGPDSEPLQPTIVSFIIAIRRTAVDNETAHQSMPDALKCLGLPVVKNR